MHKRTPRRAAARAAERVAAAATTLRAGAPRADAVVISHRADGDDLHFGASGGTSRGSAAARPRDGDGLDAVLPRHDGLNARHRDGLHEPRRWTALLLLLLRRGRDASKAVGPLKLAAGREALVQPHRFVPRLRRRQQQRLLLLLLLAHPKPPRLLLPLLLALIITKAVRTASPSQAPPPE